MRIAVMGAQCTGKTTFVNDFVANWEMYTVCRGKYTDLKKSRELNLNEEGDEDSQMAILNYLCDQIISTKESDNIIFDRCVLDNLAYTMWLNAKEKVSDNFVKHTIQIVRETLGFYDIIFFCPITKHTPINLETAENRSVDPVYREEIDNLFKALMGRYVKHDRVFFPIDKEEFSLGCPALIEIYGNREERIMLSRMYIGEDGNIFGEGESLLSDLEKEAAADLQRYITPQLPIQ